MPECRKYNELLSAYVDHELRGDEKALVEQHAAACCRCAHEVEMFRTLKGRLHVTCEHHEVPEGFWGAVSERIGDSPPQQTVLPAAAKHSKPWFLRRFVPAFGMVAVLLLIAFAYAVRPPGGITCGEMQNLVPQYAAGAINVPAASCVSEHLSHCSDCQQQHLEVAGTHPGPESAVPPGMHGTDISSLYTIRWTPPVPAGTSDKSEIPVAGR